MLCLISFASLPSVAQENLDTADRKNGRDSSDLDPTTSMGIMEIINKINEDGTTVIMATHDKDIVNYYKKRVIKLEKGILVGDTVKGGYGK